MAEKHHTKEPNLYQDKSAIKWIILVATILVSIGSIYYTNVLVSQLKERERQQIQLYGKALEYTIKENFESNIYFITQELLFRNNSVPLIWVDEQGVVMDYRNLDIDSTLTREKIDDRLNDELLEMSDTYEPIELKYQDETFGYVYYKNSFLLTQLAYFPYIQILIIGILGFIAYIAFDSSKAAEQNRVWVGLAKETAHQLATPLSSLMAWIEYIKEDPDIKNKGIAEELDKDIKKLQLITERFSNIGSSPVLKEENIFDLINNTISYLRPRISSKVQIDISALSENITAKVNAPLFEWVIENLCKNAVDAMSGSGNISIKILRGSDWRVLVDVSDTGKGMNKSKLKRVFNPGFTTKKRGWGLGLTLAKRIVETYHEGKIFVKSSEENKGTTFRIVLHA